MRAGRAGFSLLELLVVVAILGLMATVSVPALASLGADGAGTGESGVAAELAALLRAGHRQALVHGSTIELHLRPDDGRWWAWTHGEPDVVREGVLELGPDARLRTPGLRARFKFSPRGPEAATPVTVVERGEVAVIAVEPWTGGVHVRR